MNTNNNEYLQWLLIYTSYNDNLWQFTMTTYNDFTYHDFTYNDFTYNDFTYNDFTYKDYL